MWNIFGNKEKKEKKSNQESIEITENIYAKYGFRLGHEVLAKYILVKNSRKYREKTGITKVYIDKKEFERVIVEYNKDENLKFQINKTAELNNKGIAFEKAGKITEAIDVYEKNLLIGYLARHSYTRLMIIYHKEKRYDDEIRVIETAIAAFSKESVRYSKNIEKWNERLIKLQK